MQSVSQAWKNAQRQTLVPESFVEILFEVGDPNAQQDGTVSENGHEIFSEPQEILQDITEPIKYAMLEPGLWILDGTYRIVGGDISPIVSDYEGYIPYGETDTMLLADGEEFMVLVDLM